jgi:hypothetical protein
VPLFATGTIQSAQLNKLQASPPKKRRREFEFVLNFLRGFFFFVAFRRDSQSARKYGLIKNKHSLIVQQRTQWFLDNRRALAKNVSLLVVPGISIMSIVLMSMLTIFFFFFFGSNDTANASQHVNDDDVLFVANME